MKAGQWERTSGPVLAGPPNGNRTRPLPLVEGGDVGVNRPALRLQDVFFHLQLRQRHFHKCLFVVQLKQPWRSRIWNTPVDEFEYVQQFSLELRIIWCHLSRPPREIEYPLETGFKKSTGRSNGDTPYVCYV